MIDYLSLKKITDQHAAEYRETVREVVESGWYLQGKHITDFEESYAQFIGTRHCVSCANGLDALTIIFRAYMEMGKLQPGDEVIVPSNTYIASILAITENRLKPVLVEPDLDTLQIDDKLIEQAITPRTKAILIVHLYGICAYTNRIGWLCARNRLLLVEDNAQAHGCCFGNKRTGALGHAAGHSFYPSKNLGAMGDAGAITTDDAHLAEVCRTIGNYGSERKYVFSFKGRNSRMDEIQAAVLRVKLKYLDADNLCRKAIAERYYRELDNPAVHTVRIPMRDSVFHVFPVFCPERDRLQDYLKTRGIQTVIHYPIPPHKQTCYREWNSLSFPLSEYIHACELSIPCNQTMTDSEVTAVIQAINEFR